MLNTGWELGTKCISCSSFQAQGLVDSCRIWQGIVDKHHPRLFTSATNHETGSVLNMIRYVLNKTGLGLNISRFGQNISVIVLNMTVFFHNMTFLLYRNRLYRCIKWDHN